MSRKIYLIIFIIIFILISIFMMKYLKSDKKTTTQTLLRDSDDDDIPDVEPISPWDDRQYNVRKLYAQQIPFVFEDDFGTEHSPTGEGQTVAILASAFSIWYIDDILYALASNGIYHKSRADILQQISFVNASLIDGPFDYLDYTDLHLPLSNGTDSKVQYNDVRTASIELELALQTILSFVPDIKIIVFLYGFNPEICPPDESQDELPDYNEFREQYVKTIVKLNRTLIEHSEGFQIFINTLIFDESDQELITSVYNTFATLANKNIQIITSTGRDDDHMGFDYFPPSFPNILKCGGAVKLFNGTPLPHPSTNGGFYSSSPMRFQNSTIPYYQVGIVPNSPPGYDYSPNMNFVGCPDLVGYTRLVSFYMNRDPIPISIDDIFISAFAYGSLIAMVNELSNERTWLYNNIIYSYPSYLFKYIHQGDNRLFEASEYRVWNPCTGLGLLDGNRLANLLIHKYILTAYPLQISTLTVSRDMSYLNFYPLPPLEDPATLDEDSDFVHSCLAFGPQSLWSEMYFYVIDPISKMIRFPTDSLYHAIPNNSVVIITSSQINGPAWAMQYFQDTVRIQTHDIKMNVRIDDSFLWLIQNSGSVESNEQYIRLFSGIVLRPYLNQHLYLSSMYFNHSSPSLIPFQQEDTSIFFQAMPHVYHLMEPNYKNQPTKDPLYSIQSSYFLNITNRHDYLTSGFSIQNSVRGKDFASVFSSLPNVAFTKEFDETPQWLFIPLHKQHSNGFQNFGLTFGKYMLFNTRLQAYLFVNRNLENRSIQLNLININSSTSPVSKDIYNYCVFHIRGSNEKEECIFQSRPINQYPYTKINEFLCKVSISFDSPHYTPSSPFHYRLAIDETPSEQGVRITSVNEPVPNLYLFLIDTTYMCSSLQDTLISTAFRSVLNQRFLGHSVSSDQSNNYVKMMKSDRYDPKQQWEIYSQNSKSIASSTSSHVKYLALFFDKSELTFENNQYKGQYLISCERGWKPRLGFPCEDGMTWKLRPNYLNQLPSQSPNALQLSGNYLYSNTIYYIESSKGVMTCNVNTTHLPALLTEFNNENMDTVYFGSSFLINKINL